MRAINSTVKINLCVIDFFLNECPIDLTLV
jgi:hypothetical protein